MNIDTLAIARELRAAELPPVQAAAIGHAISEGSATRSDLNELRLALTSDVTELRVALTGKVDQLEAKLESKIDAKIEGLRSTLTMWFVGTGITLIGVMIAVVKL